MKFKAGKSMDQVVDEILEGYLLRCYTTVSRQYQPIENMPAEQGVAYLFEMRNAGKITISLYSVGDLVKCEIKPVN